MGRDAALAAKQHPGALQRSCSPDKLPLKVFSVIQAAARAVHQLQTRCGGPDTKVELIR